MAKIRVEIDIYENDLIDVNQAKQLLKEKTMQLVEENAGQDTFYFVTMNIISVEEILDTSCPANLRVYDVDVEFKEISDKKLEFANLLGRLSVGL